MIQHLAFAALLTRCAPQIAPSTMAAIVSVESGGDPLAIGDNTTRHSYHPRNWQVAQRLARQLLAAQHSIDVGIAQIDDVNFARLGLSVRNIFDPCVNLRAGATILSRDYAFAHQHYANEQLALRHAIGMYNTGRLDAGIRYVARVLAIARINDDRAQRPHMTAQGNAMRSPLLVYVPAARRRLAGTHPEPITPTQAPILVSNTSHTVF